MKKERNFKSNFKKTDRPSQKILLYFKIVNAKPPPCAFCGNQSCKTNADFADGPICKEYDNWLINEEGDMYCDELWYKLIWALPPKE